MKILKSMKNDTLLRLKSRNSGETRSAKAKEKLKEDFRFSLVLGNIYIYIYTTNCRQYCFGLLGLISAVLMLEWR